MSQRAGHNPAKPWEFEHLRGFLPRLQAAHANDLAALSDVAVGLAAVLQNPYAPPGIVSYEFRLPDAKPPGQRYVAELPHDWYITYVPVEWYPKPPIVYERVVFVESLNRHPLI